MWIHVDVILFLGHVMMACYIFDKDMEWYSLWLYFMMQCPIVIACVSFMMRCLFHDDMHEYVVPYYS